MIGELLLAGPPRASLAAGAVEHARAFSWDRTAAGLLPVYREAMVEHRDARVRGRGAVRRCAVRTAAW